MKVIKRITLVFGKFIDGEFFEKRVVFDTFEKLKQYILDHPEANYFKISIWRVEEPSAQEDLL